ncbi:MAG: hypothetical protein PHW96_02485 [Candidatus Nanoarchaeia archaeon]|nr:hypothetical protein [Candidatus Nanoarchaeia archaeon]
METVIVSFIGRKETALMLGKSSTKSDVEIHHYIDKGKNLTIVNPIGYPDKLYPLFVALNISDLTLIEINELNKELGETIIACDFLKKKGMFLVDVSKQHLMDSIKNMINTTNLQNWEFIVINEKSDYSKLKEKLMALETEKSNYTKITIDHVFNVKGVGVVVLGVLHGGEISSRENITLYPDKKEIQIKSIQENDIDLRDIKAKARVGLSLKNCTAEELSRNSVLSGKNLEVKSELKGKLNKSSFFKEELKSGNQITLISGLQEISCIYEEDNSEIKIKCIKPFTITEEKIILVRKDSGSMRIIGEFILN